MDKRNKKISPTSLPQKRKHVVKAGSISALKMDPDSIIIKDVPTRLSGVQLNQTHNSIGTFGVTPGDETSIGEFLVPRIPDDIVSVDKTISYKDGIATANVTIKVKNSSGKNISGVDIIYSEKA